MKSQMTKKFRRWYSSLKLKQKIKYLFLTIIGMYLILFLIIFLIFIRRNMINYTKVSNYDSMTTISNNLKSELKTINSMSQLMMVNRNMLTYLRNEKKPTSRQTSNAINSIYDISNTFNNVVSVYLYRNDMNYIHIARGITVVDKSLVRNEEWRQDMIDAQGGVVLRINGGGAYVRESGDPIISFMRVVNDLETQKPIGLLVINLSDNLLKDTYNDLNSQNRKFYYYDRSESLMPPNFDVEILPYITFNERFGQVVQGMYGKERIISYYDIPNTPFIITGVEKMSYLEFIPSVTGWIIVLLVVLTIFSLVVIGFFISMTITSPIERLVQSMSTAKEGWFHRVSLNLPDDEIGHLKDSYNEMLVTINKLISELVENERTVQKAELDVLQEQIKPHFLYNTLDTIAFLTLNESPDKVYDAIETLGSFYRNFLSKGSNEITVREEVGIVKNYLKLQKLRYEDIFEDEYEIDEELLEVKIPKLILQPLVENSLYHGIRPKGEKGTIKITIRKKENRMQIIVYDNGVGMTEEQRNQIMLENNKSFGFKGTIERVQYYYGQKDIYQLTSKEGCYSQVELMLPL